jgi:hypothetical protein
VLDARASGLGHDELASMYIEVSGERATERHHGRVCGRLRQRASVAAERCGVRGTDSSTVGAKSSAAQARARIKKEHSMPGTYHKKVVTVEEWRDVAPHETSHGTHPEHAEDEMISEEEAENADLEDDDDEDLDEDEIEEGR